MIGSFFEKNSWHKIKNIYNLTKKKEKGGQATEAQKDAEEDEQVKIAVVTA